MKETRKLLTYREIEQEAQDHHTQMSALVISIILLVVFLVLSFFLLSDTAHAYTVDQYVNAIHKAEGNENYGILSVKCTKGEGCRKVCANTVRNNLKRYARTEQNIPFVQFLGNRYCPIGASNDPNNLNKNWVKNVNYFLAKESK